MPYKTVIRNGKVAIVNQDTGKTVGTSTSKEKANASVRARLASEHGWKPTKRKTPRSGK